MRTAICAALLGLAAASPAGAQDPKYYPVSSYLPNSQVVPATTQNAVSVDTIGPSDRVDVNVFREPELSVQDVLVDDGGKIVLPMIGAVQAGGRSTEAVATEIEDRLRQYLRHPEVSVLVKQAATKHITIAGSVMEPGRYPVEGEITLLQAVALAKGPSQVAALDQALIFRTRNGQKTAARFDLRQIERGRTEDPQVLPGDTIAIGSSKFKTAWRDVVATLRSFNIFRVVP